MDRDAVPVGGGDACRGGVRIVDALPLELADIAIDRMSLAAPGLACEKDARARPEQGKRLVLGHAIHNAFLRGPVKSPWNLAINIMLAASGTYLT